MKQMMDWLNRRNQWGGCGAADHITAGAFSSRCWFRPAAQASIIISLRRNQTGHLPAAFRPADDGPPGSHRIRHALAEVTAAGILSLPLLATGNLSPELLGPRGWYRQRVLGSACQRFSASGRSRNSSISLPQANPFGPGR